MITIEEIVRDVRKISYDHHRRWAGNGLDINDLESEAMFWVFTRIDKCQQMFSLNPNAYSGYLRTSLTRLLNRFCQEELVRRTSFFQVDNERNDYRDHAKGYTYMSAKLALENKDDRVFAVADSVCTVKQMAALDGYFLQGLSSDEVADMLGVTRQTVHSAIDRAIHNIVSRSAGWSES